MNNPDSNHIDPSPNIEMFVAELFRGISHHPENSSDQGLQPTPSTKWFDPNNGIFYIPPAAKDPAEANGDRQLTNPQEGIIHLQINSDSDDAAAWRSEWDHPHQESVGCLNWKEFTAILTLAGMAWQVFFPGFF
ncbi:hypothetical protein MMC22_011426 [Lobaria immixta]|nr:hypothetical protein [Lobaria immixta]